MQNTLPSTPAKTAQLQPKQITTKCPTCKNNSVAITDIEIWRDNLQQMRYSDNRTN
ncbi:MAG: hypothetical protein K0S67_1446 [Nitrososphaeraceae archaeon]|nr:hypothetical protein [Nitrososphaeraceae archaeon]